MSQESIHKVEESRKLMRHGRDATLAYTVIGSGVALLMANLLGLHLMDFMWPGFILVPGLLLMLPAYRSTESWQSSWSFLAVPGAMFAATGILLFLMNLTDHFEAWAYSWTLVWAAAAAGWMYMKRFEPQHSIHERGHRFVRTMFIGFMGLAIFFELIVWENFNPVLPIVLIGYGIVLLMQNRRTAVS